jgi:hypothetical protein
VLRYLRPGRNDVLDDTERIPGVPSAACTAQTLLPQCGHRFVECSTFL